MPSDRSAAQTHRIGAHVVAVEDDLVTCYYKGPVALDELIAAHRFLEEALAAHPRVYQVMDFATVPMPSAAVRRWIAKWAQTHRLRAVITFGASPPLRLIMNFLQNGIRLLRGDAPLTIFVATEQAARAFVAADRLQHR